MDAAVSEPLGVKWRVRLWERVGRTKDRLVEEELVVKSVDVWWLQEVLAFVLSKLCIPTWLLSVEGHRHALSHLAPCWLFVCFVDWAALHLAPPCLGQVLLLDHSFTHPKNTKK